MAGGLWELFAKHPMVQGEWWSKKKVLTIRPEPENASQSTPKHTGHYSYYEPKLANSGQFHSIWSVIALAELASCHRIIATPGEIE